MQQMCPKSKSGSGGLAVGDVGDGLLVSLLLSSEDSAGGLKEGPPRSRKNTDTRVMGTSRVFHPFTHRHSKIGW